MSDITLHSVEHHKVQRVGHWRKKDGSKLIITLEDNRVFITNRPYMRWTAESLGREIKRNGYVTSKNLFENWSELV
jgi:hypothetical protein